MVDQFFNLILPSIEHFHLVGYWVAFFAAFLETTLVVGLLLPGSTLLLLLGALSAGGHLDFGDLLWFAIAGAILGDNLNYWLGRRYGNQWTHDEVWFLKPVHFDKTRQFFDAHGAKSVFLGRFIPSIKEIIPFVAGTVGMQRKTFLFWNVLGAVGWGLEWLGAGYLFAQSLNQAHVWLSRVGVALVVLVLLSLIFWLMKQLVLHRGQQFLHFTASLSRSIWTAVTGNPGVQELVRKHPALFGFLRKRLDSSNFFGLPVTLLSLAFVYVLGLFGGIIEDLITSDPIVSLDHSVAQLIAVIRTPEVIQVSMWVTELGVRQIAVPLLVISLLVLWLLRYHVLVLPLLVSSLGATAFTTLGKLAFHRPRPVEAVLAEYSYSFPSGHASIAVAFYGFLGYLLIRGSVRWKTRVNLFFLTGTVILLIGLSRILLGVHYISDVWAGYLVGALWLIIGISLTEWLITKNKISFQSVVPRLSRTLSMVLVASALAYYGVFAWTHQPVRAAKFQYQAVQIKGDIGYVLSTKGLQYTETLLGERQQPIGLVLLAENGKTLWDTFHKAGWVTADNANLKNLIRLSEEGIGYVSAPLTPAFWNGHLNDYAFKKQLNDKMILAVRLWETPYRIGKGELFIGVVMAYNGIRWRVLHTISPDVDAARDELLQSLKEAGMIRYSCTSSFIEPEVGQYPMGGSFFTRGELLMLDLSPSQSNNALCPTNALRSK